MSNIDYTNIISQFENLADDFIEKINNTTITLYFDTGTPTVSTGIVLGGRSPLDTSLLGGKGNLSDFDGKENRQGGGYQMQPRTEQIKCRAYWVDVKNSAEMAGLGIKDVEHVCKIITYTSYNTLLKNCLYIQVNGLNCDLIKDPIPHGLGNKRYSTSYWEVQK